MRAEKRQIFRSRKVPDLDIFCQKSGNSLKLCNVDKIARSLQKKRMSISGKYLEILIISQG